MRIKNKKYNFDKNMKVSIFSRSYGDKNLVEFMKYHFFLGIDKIYIYNDDTIDLNSRLLQIFDQDKFKVIDPFDFM